MAYTATFKYNNLDATSDLNLHTRVLVNKGVVSGFTVSPVAGTANVTVAPGYIVSADGMIVRSSAVETATCTAGIKNNIVFRAVYNAPADPTLQLQSRIRRCVVHGSEHDVVLDACRARRGFDGARANDHAVGADDVTRSDSDVRRAGDRADGESAHDALVHKDPCVQVQIRGGVEVVVLEGRRVSHVVVLRSSSG